MNNERINSILKSIKAFNKTSYYKAEALPECLKLQDELVRLVFAEEHAECGKLRLNDVLNHFRQKNEELGYVADEELAKFEEGCKDMNNEIRGRISGERGEQKVYRALENLKVSNKVQHNIEFTEDDERTELDAIVTTPQAIFIVEVKNTGKDIFIDSKGGYYRVGKYNSFDCNIGEKMECKERLLRKALIRRGVQNPCIEKVLVFTNNQIEVANEYEALQICFLSQLCYRINSYKGENVYSENMMEQIEKAIEDEFDKEQFDLQQALEEAGVPAE